MSESSARSAKATDPCPTGRISRASLEACPGYEPLPAHSYVPDPGAVSVIRATMSNLQVLVFIGTWCPDCKRELPRFFRIVSEAGLADAQITLCAIDRLKRDPDGLASIWGIRAVPTFIFSRDGQELGRIIERPTASLEGDIARLLAEK